MTEKRTWYVCVECFTPIEPHDLEMIELPNKIIQYECGNCGCKSFSIFSDKL